LRGPSVRPLPRTLAVALGGTSALPTDRHYLDLLPAYLTNDTYLVRVRPADVAAAPERVTVLEP